MRKLVLQMITTLNGRLDSPHEWVNNPGDDVDTEFNHVCETFDTVLLGHKTYDEMAAYWPNAEASEDTSAANKSLAHKLNSYKKYVFSSGNEHKSLAWNNAEWVLAHSDQDIINFVNNLKAQQGRDIHLAGGARLPQSLIRLGLVDEYRFYVYPVISHGLSWFDPLKNKLDLELLSTITYQNGVLGLHYRTLRN